MVPAPDDPQEEESAPGESEPTIRISTSPIGAAALRVLRGVGTSPSPVPPPPTASGAGASDEEPPVLTPRTVVVSTIVRADRGTLTLLVGPSAGATLTLEKDETILGRDAHAGLVLDDLSVSRRHARITRDARAHYFIEDLGSTNGTFVSGRRVRRSALTTGDRVQLGRDTVFRFAVVDIEEESFQRRLFEASTRDVLTGLPNRRCLFDRLESEVSHARRTRGELGVLMLDLDRFKEVNDRYGHLVGDEVLHAVAGVAARAVRAGDVLARFGGEEFAVLGRDLDKGDAIVLAERLRSAVKDVRVTTPSADVGITVSIGAAVLSECHESAGGTELLALADERLYAAKRAGRNRTIA